ncbi:MAG: hypothetical protein DRH24_17250 [Deltaproteobacteria bacterium]|nr:MAG: hypothetical protein DRH24_17250 [Deltaproteobacteria bacterium]
MNNFHILSLSWENFSLAGLLPNAEKLVVILVILLLAVFSLLVAKQIILLDQFLKTKMGSYLKAAGVFYVFAVTSLLILSIILL